MILVSEALIDCYLIFISFNSMIYILYFVAASFKEVYLNSFYVTFQTITLTFSIIILIKRLDQLVLSLSIIYVYLFICFTCLINPSINIINIINIFIYNFFFIIHFLCILLFRNNKSSTLSQYISFIYIMYLSFSHFFINIF